jgi:transcription elongation factor GreA
MADGAAQMMRSLGLAVDGPVMWSSPVGSRRPGVFVVELGAPLADAPIDHAALRRWLEQVPGLRLDGERPTTRDLAGRLELFWQPAESVVYVGRSTRALGARVAAMYATGLGDDRPHPGGHWLKTLRVLRELRIWWAETDAHEEYEDALLAEFASLATRQPPPGTGPLLPFANLADAYGQPRRHGLSEHLRPPPAGAGSTAPAKPPSQTARRTASPRSRSRPAATKAAGRPKPAPTYLSRDGADQLAAELEQLRNEVRPGVIARVKAARELGDLRENAEYESARKEQSFLEGRIQTLEALLKSAHVVDEAPSAGVVAVGSTVLVTTDGEEHTFVLVGSSEADPSSGRISYVSPIGQALMGRRSGEQVTVRLPGGEAIYDVREIR